MYDAEELRKAITDLGLKYKLPSKYTSFVGIDSEGPDGQWNPAGMVTRDVPNQIPPGMFGHVSNSKL